MTITEVLKQENPWDVSNIQEFLYYNCPECDIKERDSEVFIQHALDNHELSKAYLDKPKVAPESQNQDEIISHQETEDIEEKKPTEDELKVCDMKVVRIRLHKIKVESDVLLKGPDSKKRKVEYDQDTDYEPGSDLDSDVDIPAEDEDDVKPDEDDVKLDEDYVKTDESFFCDKCDKFFKSTLSLKVHIALKHSEQRKIQCPQCDAAYTRTERMAHHAKEKHFNSVSCHKCDYKCHSKIMLEDHWKTFHKLRYRFVADNEGNFTCKVCIFKTQNEEEMKYHQWEHLDIQWAYKCELCEATFSHKFKYQDHKDVVHMGILPFKCEQCDLSFKSKSSLTSHIKRVHATVPTHICTVCGKSVVHLKQHMKLMHPDKEDDGGTCDQCGMFFEKKYLLSNHKHTFHKRKFQVCTICEKFFDGIKKEKLINHYTDEHAVFCNKDTIYICDICKTKVTSTKELAEHYHTVHESKDDFDCSKCDHKEPTKALLSLHCIDTHNMNPFKDFGIVNETTVQVIKVQDHKDNKAFKCSICSKKMTSKETLKNHIKQVHDKSNHVKCEHCPNTYAYPSDLKKHILQKHAPKTKFPCSQCSYVTNLKGQLNAHFRTAHEIKKLHKCNVCEKPYEQIGRLQKHMLKAHDILYKY